MDPTPLPADAPGDELAADSAADSAADLAQALRAGRDVLGAWYRAEYPRVHRLCRGFLASRTAADDVAQDALLHLADQLERWDPARPYAAWRNQVVVNLCRDRERAASRREHHEGAARRPEVPAPDPADVAASRELAAWIDRCLGALPPREREVFVLVDLEGADAAAVGEQLGVTASTVRAALAMARRRMRELLAPAVRGEVHP